MILLLLLAAILSAQTPVWIDVDPCVEPGGHEVDDGFALIQAFHSKEIAIRGVSVVYGNAPVKSGLATAEKLMSMLAPQAPKPYGGADSATQMGQETAASVALAAVLRRERLTILALGPATNIATMLKLHPELGTRIDRIVAVAGRRLGQHFVTGTTDIRPLGDVNFEADPEAFQVLLDSGVPLTLAPWELASNVWITPTDLANLNDRNPALDFLHTPATDWLAFFRRKYSVNGFNPIDTLAVGILTSPGLIACENLPIEIEPAPDDTILTEGNTQTKLYLMLSRRITAKRSAEYCDDVKPAFKRDLLRRLDPGAKVK